MQITVERLYEVMNALVAIANTPRQIPQIAKFKLARMHDALKPAFQEYHAKRIALVQKYGEEQFADPEKTISLGWGVRPNSDGEKAVNAEWEPITKETVEAKITPITLTMLGNDPKGLEVTEFAQLGDLVIDDQESEETRG